MTEPPHRRGQDHDGLLHRPAITEPETFICEACGDDCEGTSECNGCSRMLCLNCGSEYENACSVCYGEAPIE